VRTTANAAASSPSTPATRPTAASVFAESTSSWLAVFSTVRPLADSPSADSPSADSSTAGPPSSSSASTWLLAIARRAAVDAVRASARRRRLAGLLGARTAGDAGTAGLADGVLTDDALGRFDTDRRTAFALTQLLGFDYATAAEICGCPVGTIRSRVARAREQLVAEMGSPLAAAADREPPRH
jgi:RNA polymerase sigma-70 factor (ECF subfamily)